MINKKLDMVTVKSTHSPFKVYF